MKKKLTLHLFLGRLLSSLTVVLVCVLCLSPLYSLLSAQLARNMTADSARQFALAGQRWNSDLSNLRFTTNKLFNQDSLQLLSIFDDQDSENDISTVMRASEDLQDLTYSMSFGTYSYITFAQNDMVLDAFRAFSTRERFFSAALCWPDAAFEDWNAACLSTRFRILPARLTSLNGTSYYDRYLTIQQPYITAGGKFRGTFNLLVCEKDVLANFLPFESAGEYLFCLADAEGAVLCAQNWEGDRSPQGEEGASCTANGHKYILIRLTLSDGSTAVAGIPGEVYTQDVRQMRRLVIGYLLLALTACLAHSALMTAYDVKNYRPLLSQLKLTENSATREFSTHYLMKRVSKELTSRSHLTGELNHTRELLQHTQAEMLLRSGQGSDHTKQELSALFRLQADNYLLLLYLPAGAAGTEELFYLALCQTVGEVFSSDPYIYRFSQNEILVFLTGVGNTDQALLELNGHLEALRAKLPDSLRFILSSRFSGIERVSAAYWQVHNAVPVALLSSDTVCYLHPDTLGQSSAVDVGQLSRLNEYLLTGSAELAAQQIRQMFPPECLLPQNFQQIFYSIRGVLLSVAQQSGAPDITHLCAFSNQLPTKKLIDNLCDCCFEIGNHVDSLKRSHNEKLRRDMLQYLEEHYSDPNLCTAMAADHFGVSKKYFSQFLRDQTGKNYTEYVEDLRLGKAMEFLQGTDLSITEIALRCGFSTQNTFYKAFRKRYGVSPSAIRRRDP